MLLWDKLGLNENTPYEQYELELQKNYNYMVDMYGEEENSELILSTQIQVLGEEAVPQTQLDSKPYMEQIMRCFQLNINLPGTMEAEHPHKFMQNLRPIEEFRHTPLIPVSQKQMKEFLERVLAYHRRGFFFEVKKETIMNYVILGAAVAMGSYMIRLVLKKEEETGIALERLQIQRQKQAQNM